MPGSRLKKHRREQIRAAILIIMEVSYPNTTGERTVQQALGDVDDHVGVNELRTELSYVEERGLIELDKSYPKQWKVKLTADGLDVVQKVKDRPPGIGPIDLDAGVNIGL